MNHAGDCGGRPGDGHDRHRRQGTGKPQPPPQCQRRWELSDPIDDDNTPQVPQESHSLRHSCARHWLQSGLNVNAVSTWQGRSSPTGTLDTYLVLAPDTPWGESTRLRNRRCTNQRGYVIAIMRTTTGIDKWRQNACVPTRGQKMPGIPHRRVITEQFNVAILIGRPSQRRSFQVQSQAGNHRQRTPDQVALGSSSCTHL